MANIEPIDGLPAWMRQLERRLRALELARGRGKPLAEATTPATPPAMVVTSEEGTIRATWDGTFIDDDTTPANFVGLDVYAVPAGQPHEPNPEFHLGTITRPYGGSISASVVGGDYEVFSVTRTTRDEGHAGDAVPITVEPLVDEGDLDDAIGSIEVGGVFYGPTPPADPIDKMLWFEGPLPGGPFVPQRYDANGSAWVPATLDGDQAIDHLSVGKLVTGTLDAIVTVSGVIRTNDDLQVPRFEIDDQGFWYGVYGQIGSSDPFRQATYLRGDSDGILARGTLEAMNAAGTSGVRIRPYDSADARAKGIVEFVESDTVQASLVYGLRSVNLPNGYVDLKLTGPGSSPARLNLGSEQGGSTNSSALLYGRDVDIVGGTGGYVDIDLPESGTVKMSAGGGGGTSSTGDLTLHAGGSYTTSSPARGSVMVRAGVNSSGSIRQASSTIDLVTRTINLDAPNVSVDGNTITGLWTTYPVTLTATVTNPSGSYSLTGRYKRIGRIVHIYIEFNANSGFDDGSGAWIFSLPVAARSTGSGRAQLLLAHVISGGEFSGVGKLDGGSEISRTYAGNMLLNNGFNGSGIDAGNRVMFSGSYEAASG